MNPIQRRYYAGIGSRETPHDVLNLMTSIAERLENMGYILRSGHARGADRAFELGISNPYMAHIYLPWDDYGVKQYKDDPGMPIRGLRIAKSRKSILEDYEKMVEEGIVSPNLPEAHRLLHGRNYSQIYGMGAEPHSSFVVAWTPDGAETLRELSRDSGGTGVTIKLAADFGIPVFNLRRPDAVDRLWRFVTVDMGQVPPTIVSTGRVASPVSAIKEMLMSYKATPNQLLPLLAKEYPEGASTLDLMRDYMRTATTRKAGYANVGDIVRFTDGSETLNRLYEVAEVDSDIIKDLRDYAGFLKQQLEEQGRIDTSIKLSPQVIRWAALEGWHPLYAFSPSSPFLRQVTGDNSAQYRFIPIRTEGERILRDERGVPIIDLPSTTIIPMSQYQSLSKWRQEVPAFAQKEMTPYGLNALMRTAWLNPQNAYIIQPRPRAEIDRMVNDDTALSLLLAPPQNVVMPDALSEAVF